MTTKKAIAIWRIGWIIFCFLILLLKVILLPQLPPYNAYKMRNLSVFILIFIHLRIQFYRMPDFKNTASKKPLIRPTANFYFANSAILIKSGHIKADNVYWVSWSSISNFFGFKFSQETCHCALISFTFSAYQTTLSECSLLFVPSLSVFRNLIKKKQTKQQPQPLYKQHQTSRKAETS